MIELTKKLPSKVSEKAKTTAEQLIDLGYGQGIEQGYGKGVEQGIEQGIEVNSLETLIELLNLELSVDIISSVTKINKETVELFQINNDKKYSSNLLKKELAKHLIKNFKYLKDADIAKFAKLKEKDIPKLRNISEN
jgi:flagellar biosynthesis/type III secretory pathway protein FliH